MTAYRDQYASLFHDGRHVVVIGISNDSPQSQYSWLKDEDFPFVFASEKGNDAATYVSFGGKLTANHQISSRTVIVIAPDGRIAGVIPSFNQIDPAAYKTLAKMIDSVTPTSGGSGS